MEENFELVKGKRCIVVAPSGYLKGRGQKSGQFIESFDCVVKCTSTVQLDDPHNELGLRCDLWYGLPHYPSWSVSFEALRRQSVKLMYFQPRLERYADAWDDSVNWFLSNNNQYEFRWKSACKSTYEALISKFECIPFTGVFAIVHLLNMGAKEVYAYGHDFYQTGYFNEVSSARNDGGEWHKIEPQMFMLWQLLQSEPRFSCDNNLKQILTERFSTKDEIIKSSQQLLLTDLSHFVSESVGDILIFRSCNIETFRLFLRTIESYYPATDVGVICQSSFVSQLNGQKSNIIDYCRDTPFKADEVIEVIADNGDSYNTCLIPYNGLELWTYFEIFLAVNKLKINRVFLMSMRGALVKIDDVSGVCDQIAKYLKLRDEFRMLNDKYDRRNCL
jgi:hypothetical protein